jgi:uncharacterized surface protein with fasciclin (FAS1) repeats
MKIKDQIKQLIGVFAIAFTVFSCSNDNNNQEITKLPTIVEIAKADPTNFSILVKALEVTGLTTTFNSPGSYTVFAPTNAAFTSANITEASLAALNPTVPADATTIAGIKKILQNHVLGIGTKASDLLAAGYVKTFSPFGTSTSVTLSMYINKSGSDVLINGGAANGGAKVTAADLDASNGIVHIVDNVIKLPKIVNFAVANPDLSTLVSIVTSGVTDPYGDQSAVLTTLNGAGPLTVFAPTNAAFTTATGPTGFLTGLTATAANISKVLKYHVSNGNLTSSSATSWTSATATTDVTITTLATPQTFKIALGTLKITELPAITVPASNIKAVNIQATNGVIHVLDRVLQPVLP